jgi:hypothetical protein
MICPVCRRSRLVEIDLTLQGEEVRMRSCSRCDTRWWERHGQRVTFEGLLAASRQTVPS